MQTFALLALFGGAVTGSILDRAPKCNADNCYRVMTNTPAVASQFCSTYLQSTATVTVTPVVTIRGTYTFSPSAVPTITPQAVPNHISQQCVLSTATPLATRLSSACSCISATPVSTAIVTSTVTVAPITTVMPPTPCEALTENSNTYEVNGNDPYSVICDQWFWANYQHPGFTGLASFQDCMAACSQDDQCLAVDWREPSDGNESGCGILYDFEGPIEGTALDACAIRNNPPYYDDWKE